MFKRFSNRMARKAFLDVKAFTEMLNKNNAIIIEK